MRTQKYLIKILAFVEPNIIKKKKNQPNTNQSGRFLYYKYSKNIIVSH